MRDALQASDDARAATVRASAITTTAQTSSAEAATYVVSHLDEIVARSWAAQVDMYQIQTLALQRTLTELQHVRATVTASTLSVGQPGHRAIMQFARESLFRYGLTPPHPVGSLLTLVCP